MEENKDLFENTKPEESSDYFSEEGNLESGLQGSEVSTPSLEAAEPAAASDEAKPASDEAAGTDTADWTKQEPGDITMTSAPESGSQEEAALSAQRKAQEEAELAAQRKAQEEAELAAQRKAQEEAELAAQRKAQEEAELAAMKQEQEKARLAEEKKAMNEKKAAERAARREARRQAWKNWVPGPKVPNQLTIARIFMIPLVVVLILWVPKPLGNILSMIVFILACLTDAADGYIARRYNYITTFGKFMDPLADKLLVCSAMICLVDLGRLESWIVIIIIAREFIISGFRLVAVEKGVVIAANFWGKIKTISQMLMVILMLANFGGILALAAQFLKWISLALTLISLATYLIQNRHVLQDNAS